MEVGDSLLVKKIKRIITRLLFGNKYALRIKYIGKDSKVGLLYNFLNGKYITIGSKSVIGRYSKLQCFDNFNGHIYHPSITIGNNCLLGQNITIWSADEVKIEDNVTIAGYCTLINENHGIDVESELTFLHQTLTSAPIKIGEGTWIGERCIILPGVEIGKKCVVGSGSIVTKSIPDYSMVVGNPARIIKKWSFDKHQWESVNGK